MSQEVSLVHQTQTVTTSLPGTPRTAPVAAIVRRQSTSRSVFEMARRPERDAGRSAPGDPGGEGARFSEPVHQSGPCAVASRPGDPHRDPYLLGVRDCFLAHPHADTVLRVVDGQL